MLSLPRDPNDPSPHEDVLRLRLSRNRKHRVEAAATALGLDTSTFVRQTIAREADAVLAAQTGYRMTQADLDAFAAAMDTPPAPTPAALRAAARYRARVVHAD